MRQESEQPLDLEGTDDPVFATNIGAAILGWNTAACKLLGYARTDVVGRRCYEIVRGWDIFGNRFCREDCNLHQMVRRNEPIHGFRVDLHTSSGETLRVGYSVNIVRPPRGQGLAILHRLEPTDGAVNPVRGRASAHVSGAQPRLTARELEVLRIVADGRNSVETARLLHVSAETVRTHVQNILGKLGVHSRIEAVSVARRLCLL